MYNVLTLNIELFVSLITNITPCNMECIINIHSKINHLTVINLLLFQQLKEVKLSPIWAMKTRSNVDVRVHIFKTTAARSGRVASPMLTSLYFWENPSTHFKGGRVVPGPIWTWSEEKSAPCYQDRTWAIKPITKHLAA